MLLAVCVFVGCCLWLFAVGCLLFVVCLVVVRCGLLFAACALLSDASSRVLLAAGGLVFGLHVLWLVVYCLMLMSLLVVGCLWRAGYGVLDVV